MAEYLGEDCAAIATELFFPRVQTCCAVIVSSTQNNALGGYHLTLFSSKWEVDRALLYLKDALGGQVDGVYMVGNVLGRTNLPAGLSYAQALKKTLADGLGYAFSVKYLDTGFNHAGVAVRAWRDPVNNVLRLNYASPGQWAYGGNVAPGLSVVQIKALVAASADGNAGEKLRLKRPTSVQTCALNAPTAVSPFLMQTF